MFQRLIGLWNSVHRYRSTYLSEKDAKGILAVEVNDKPALDFSAGFRFLSLFFFETSTICAFFSFGRIMMLNDFNMLKST